jgi:hypothetical protein
MMVTQCPVALKHTGPDTSIFQATSPEPCSTCGGAPSGAQHERPNDRPNERPTERPTERPIDERPNQRTTDRTTDRRTNDRPNDRPNDRSTRARAHHDHEARVRGAPRHA